MSVGSSVAISIDSPAAGGEAAAEALARELGIPIAPPDASDEGFRLTLTDEGLELRPAGDPVGTGLRVDFHALDLRPGSASLSRRQPLARAIGRRARTVLDATAGLGLDAALLAALGYEVTAVERSPIIAALLRDGLARASRDERVSAALGGRVHLVTGDAREVLPRLPEPPDVIYIDPMFPPKRKSSALARKPIRLLRQVVGDDDDAAALLAVARTRARERVVVKRPPYAGELSPADDPEARADFSLSSKLVRYDVWRGAAPGTRAASS